jgi:drug/metabolite transporter (DMT)-like permease
LTIVIAALAAVAAGICLAAAGVLQHRAASRRPSDERMSLRLLMMLASDRTWLAGIGSALLSYGFQAVALTFGPLTLVQPLIVSELLFAVPVSVRMRDLRLHKREWIAIASVVAGLALGIVAANPGKGDPTQPISVWAPALVAVAVITAGCVLVARMVSGPVKATAFALAGATAMGFQSGLYAATIALLRTEHWLLFTHWEPYALVVASLVGMFLIQNAFQSGPLAASTPVLDATLPLVAIAIGVWLFNEQIRTTAFGLGGAAVGIALLIIGIIGLDTSPVVRREQQIEQEEKEETEREETQEEAQAEAQHD